MEYDVEDFDKEVIQRSSVIPVLVEFWADWCGPCRILSPVLERLADRHKGKWELKKLNTEEFPDIAARYEIRSIPNVKLFSKGSVIEEFVGVLPESNIEQWLARSLPDNFENQLDGAESFIRQQRYEDARQMLEPILSVAPEHQRARALLGLSVVYADRKRAMELVSNIDEASRYWDIAETVRTVNALLFRLESGKDLPDSPAKSKYLDAISDFSKRNFDKALNEFIEVVRSDRYYDDDGSRKACIAIFKLLGEEHEMTIKYRREFSNALYI